MSLAEVLDHRKSAIIELQVLIKEYYEFLDQWNRLFEILHERSGKEVQEIFIQNNRPFNQYCNYYPAIIYNRFFSLLDLEIKRSRHSLFKTCIQSLKIKPLSEFCISHDFHFKNLEELAEQMMSRNDNYDDLLELKNHWIDYQNLWEEICPKSCDTGLVSFANIFSLYKNTRALWKKYKSPRHFLSHINEPSAVKKHEKKARKVFVESSLQLDFNLYCKYFENVSLIYRNEGLPSFEKIGIKESVSDSIDIILFGNINSVCNHYGLDLYNDQTRETRLSYYQRRKEYFNSNKCLKLID